MTTGTPEGYAAQAQQAEKDGDYAKAADLWFAARAATIGHTRAERYRQQEQRCRNIVDEQMQPRNRRRP
jgi:hypothetical protein